MVVSPRSNHFLILIFLIVLHFSSDGKARGFFPACEKTLEAVHCVSCETQEPPLRPALDIVTSFLPHLSDQNSCFDGKHGLKQHILSSLLEQKLTIGYLYECALNPSKYRGCNAALKSEKDKLLKPTRSDNRSPWELMREGLAMSQGIDWTSPESAIKGIRPNEIRHPFKKGIFGSFLSGKPLPPLIPKFNNTAQSVLLNGILNVAKANCPDAAFVKYNQHPIPVQRTGDGSYIYEKGPVDDPDGSDSKLLTACMARRQVVNFPHLATMKDAQGNLRVVENLRYFFPYNYLGKEYPQPIRPNYFLDGNGLGRVGQWDGYFKTKLRDLYSKQYWDALSRSSLMAHVTSSNPSNAELAEAFKKISENISKLGTDIIAGALLTKPKDWDYLQFGEVVNQWLLENPRCCDFAKRKIAAGKTVNDAVSTATMAASLGTGLGCIGGAILSAEVSAVPCAVLGLGTAGLELAANESRFELASRIADSSLAVDDLRDLESLNSLRDRAFWSREVFGASAIMDIAPAIRAALKARVFARSARATHAAAEDIAEAAPTMRTSVLAPRVQVGLINDLEQVAAQAHRYAAKYGAKDVLVVFDYDDVIATSPSHLGSDAWYRWQNSLIVDSEKGSDMALRRDKLLRLQESIRRHYPVRPVQSNTVALIRELQAAGVKTKIVTARNPLFKELTEEDLQRFGLHFDEIVYTAGEDKGIVVSQLLKKNGSRAALFVDDSAHHVASVSDALNRTTGVREAFVYRYGRTDAFSKALDNPAAKAATEDDLAKIRSQLRIKFKEGLP